MDWTATHYSLAAVKHATGVSDIAIRSWLTRKSLLLDAEKKREGTRRRFSLRDATLIAFVYELSRIGVTISDAPDLAEAMLDSLNDGRNLLLSNVVAIFRDKNDDWKLVEGLDTDSVRFDRSAVPDMAIYARPVDTYKRVAKALKAFEAAD